MDYTNESLERCFDLYDNQEFEKLKPLLVLTIEVYSIRLEFLKKNIIENESVCLEFEDGLRVLNMKKSALRLIDDTLKILKDIDSDIKFGTVKNKKHKASNLPPKNKPLTLF